MGRSQLSSQRYLALGDFLIAGILMIVIFLTQLLPALQTPVILYPIGFVFVLFLPGYLLLAALFPSRDSLDGLERIAYSIGLSIVVVGGITTILGLTSTFSRLSLLLAMATVMGGAGSVGGYRRLKTDPNDWFHRPILSLFSHPIADTTGRKRSRVTLGAIMLVWVVTLAAIGSTGFTVSGAVQEEQFTEFYVLDAAEKSQIPTNETINNRTETPKNIVIGITNQEEHRVKYTVVVQRQQVIQDENKTSVRQRKTVSRFNATLTNNEQWTHLYEIAQPKPKAQNRLVFYLFKGDAPETLTTQTANQTLHVWVND
jgi:uncharacterized membrane protein